MTVRALQKDVFRLIEQLATNRKMTRETLIAKAKVGRSAYYSWKRGATSPTLRDIDRLVDVVEAGFHIQILASSADRAVTGATGATAALAESVTEMGFSEEAAEVAALVNQLEPDAQQWVKRAVYDMVRLKGFQSPGGATNIDLHDDVAGSHARRK